MPVHVQQAGTPKQGLVGKDFARSAPRRHPPAVQNVTPVGNFLDDGQIVCGGHGRLGSAARGEKIDHVALAAGIQGGCRLVEQQDVRIEDQNRGQRDAFFFTAGEPVGRAVFQVGDFHFRHGGLDAVGDAILWPAHLERPESDLVKYRRVEKLDVGILKNHADPPAKIKSEPIIRQRRLGKLASVKENRSGGRVVESVEQAEKRGFPRAVGAEDHDPFARRDGKRDAVQRGGFRVLKRDRLEIEKHGRDLMPTRAGRRERRWRGMRPAPTSRAVSSGNRPRDKPRHGIRATAWREKPRC